MYHTQKHLDLNLFFFSSNAKVNVVSKNMEVYLLISPGNSIEVSIFWQ